MAIVIESCAFIGVAAPEAGATAQVWLPPGFTLTGGGAYELGHGPVNCATGSYPTRNRSGIYTGWAAAGTGESALVPQAVYAIGIRIARNGEPVEIEQQVFCATSALVAHPCVSVKLGRGWTGTGGGAQDNRAARMNGNMVTAGYPLLDADGDICGWSANGKVTDMADQGRVTAFVIGIKPGEGISLGSHLASHASLLANYPNAAISVPGLSEPVFASGPGEHVRGWYALRTAPAPQRSHGAMFEAA